MSRKKLSFFLIISVLLLDQISKIWIKSHYDLNSSITNFGFIHIDFIENPGMAFGFSFGNLYGKYLLSIFRIGAVFGIGWYLLKLIRNKTHIIFVGCISLIFAGALGNILDSVFYGLIFDKGTVWDPVIGAWDYYTGEGVAKLSFKGYAGVLEGCVVDMIHFKFNWPEWAPFGFGGKEVFPPVFNIADFSISLSVGVIVVFYKKIVRDEDVNFKKLFKLNKINA